MIKVMCIDCGCVYEIYKGDDVHCPRCGSGKYKELEWGIVKD